MSEPTTEPVQTPPANNPPIKHFPLIGMTPSVWGPIIWTTMHIVTLGYSPVPTDQEKKAAIEFFEALVYLIPCPICRIHYKSNLEAKPIRNAVNSRNELIVWVFQMHNEVNKHLKKPELTMEQFIKHLSELSNKDSLQIPPPEANPHSMPLMLGIGMLLGVGLGAAGLYYYKKNT